MYAVSFLVRIGCPILQVPRVSSPNCSQANTPPPKLREDMKELVPYALYIILEVKCAAILSDKANNYIEWPTG